MINLLLLTARGWKSSCCYFSICCFLVVTFPIGLSAQLKHDYVWAIGYNDNPAGSPPGFWLAESLLSFNSNPPDTIRLQTYYTRGSVNNMSMANSKGELIFYSNGCSLFDADGNMLPGGEEILHGETFDSFCRRSLPRYPTWDGSTIALPMDDKDSLFYVIYHRWEVNRNAEGFENPLGIVSFELYKIKVVLNQDGKYEAQDRNLILRQNLGNGNFAAVRDTQAHHWWVIIPPDVHLNNYEIIRLGPNGVDTILTQYFFYEGEHFEDDLVVSGGSVVFSQDGSIYARWIAGRGVGTMWWDFNREKGEMSNFRYLPHPDDEWIIHESSAGGISFSPSGRFLYVNTMFNLYQYDLWEEDVESSIVHIAEFNGYLDSSTNFLNPVIFGFSRLAPNCKIYMVPQSTTRYLHVINYPDRKGLACDFRQQGLPTPGKNRFGIPYHPNYRLDSDYLWCDSTITTTTWFVPDEAEAGIYLYPNPAREYVVVGWSDIEPVEIALYDMSGREVYSSRMQPGLPEYYLDLSGFSAGVYVVRVRDRSGGVGVERLILSY